MSVSSALPLAMVGIAFFFLEISNKHEKFDTLGAKYKKYFYYTLSLWFILGSLVVMANLASDDSLTAIESKMEALFETFAWVIVLEVWIIFLILLKDTLTWWQTSGKRGRKDWPG